MKLAWQRVKIFFYYLHLAWNRWTKPRVYVVQYAYINKEGNMKYDAHLVRGVDFDVRSVISYLQKNTNGKNLIILGLNEVPGAIYNGPVLESAKAFVTKIDQVADNFKPGAVQEEPAEEEEDDEEDATSILG